MPFAVFHVIVTLYLRKVGLLSFCPISCDLNNSWKLEWFIFLK